MKQSYKGNLYGQRGSLLLAEKEKQGLLYLDAYKNKGNALSLMHKGGKKET